MKIETEQYQIANISDNEKAVNAIKQAENEIAKATGTPVTLIAYMPTTENDSEYVFEV